MRLFKKMTAVLPADANLTLVAHMLMSRRLAEGDTTTETPDVGVSHSTAEEIWAVMFLVVVLLLALCMICACCGIAAQLLGCGSFLTEYLLSCFGTVAKLCTSCCSCSGDTKKKTPKAPVVVSDDVPEAKVIGPAYESTEELKPLRPKREAPPTEYTCCGFALPCLAWFSVCGCSFVGCAWLTTCWKRSCGGGGERRGRRQTTGGGLSFVQNLLTCWRCCGLLPTCCPAQYEWTPPPRRSAVATPKPPAPKPPPPTPPPPTAPPPVVKGEPVFFVGVAPRPMPSLNLV